MNTRVLLVDDSPFVLEELSRILTEAEGFQIAGTAHHGLSALEVFDGRRPDLVSLDVQMPVMNGLQTLKHLMTRVPVPVVMVSALTAEDDPLTFESLRLGAVDFVEKPGGGRPGTLSEQKQLIVDRFRRAARIQKSRLRVCSLRRPPLLSTRRRAATPSGVIAASVGRAGLSPILKFLNGFPSGLGLALVFVFDLRIETLQSLARYLERFSALQFACPRDTVRLEPEAVFLVSGLTPALLIEERGEIRLQQFSSPARARKERFIEMFFASCAEIFASRTHALLFSGTLPGALYGCQRVREKGGRVFCQAPSSAIEPEVLQIALDSGLTLRSIEPEGLLEATVASVLQTA